MKTHFANGLTLEVEPENVKKLFNQKLSKIRVLKGLIGEQTPITLEKFIPNCNSTEYLGSSNDVRMMIALVSEVKNGSSDKG